MEERINPPRESSSPRRSLGFLVGMSLMMLGANLVWISYNSVLLPTLVEEIVPESKGLVVGLAGFFGILVGIVASFVAGMLSDHTTNRWGRRTPALLFSTLVSLPLIGLPSLFLSPAGRAVFWPQALAITLLSFCGMQFASNIGNGAWWPLLVDLVPQNQRGLASGVQGFLNLLGSALGILVITALNENGLTELALWLIGGVFFLCGMVSILTIHGKDLPADPSLRMNLFAALRDMFKVRTRVAVFFWLVAATFLAYMGINSMTFFARYFFEVYFPAVSPDTAFRMLGGISLVATMLSAIAAGALSDKIGRRSLVLGGMFVCAAATLMMGLTEDYILFLVTAGIRAIAMGPILTTAQALASDLTPQGEAGQYMAYNNLATGVSGALSALVFGFLLIEVNRATFMALFIASAFFFLSGAMVMALKVSQKELNARQIR